MSKPARGDYQLLKVYIPLLPLLSREERVRGWRGCCEAQGLLPHPRPWDRALCALEAPHTPGRPLGAASVHLPCAHSCRVTVPGSVAPGWGSLVLLIETHCPRPHGPAVNKKETPPHLGCGRGCAPLAFASAVTWLMCG